MTNELALFEVSNSEYPIGPTCPIRWKNRNSNAHLKAPHLVEVEKNATSIECPTIPVYDKVHHSSANSNA